MFNLFRGKRYLKLFLPVDSMLKFFRSIRKKLMKQNKIRTYLFYAIGEILLVVIGILIALQVNNWNQNRLDSAAAANAQVRMVNDLYEELTDMESTLSYIKIVREYALKAISVFEMGVLSDETSPDSFLIDLYQASQVTDNQQSNSTYLELLASGKIGFIENDSLRSSIISHYSYDWTTSIVFMVQDPYRENIRRELPSSIQSRIRNECGDQYVKTRIVLPESCNLSFDGELAKETASNILESEVLKSDLRYRIGNLDSQILLLITFKDNLEKIIADLEAEI